MGLPPANPLGLLAKGALRGTALATLEDIEANCQAKVQAMVLLPATLQGSQAKEALPATNQGLFQATELLLAIDSE